MWPRALPAGPTRPALRTWSVGLALQLAGLCVVLPALTLPVGAGPPVAAAQMPATIEVDVRQGLLAVDIRNVPLADILRLIGERAGFRVLIQGEVSTPVTAMFTGVPLDQGIKRLAREHSFVLLYAPVRDGTRGPVLAEVRLYGAGPSAGGAAGVGATPPPVASRGGPGEPAARASNADSATPTAQGRKGVAPGEPALTAGSSAWIAQVLSAPEPSARLQALNVPLPPGDARVTATLARVLDRDPDDNVRATAARLLGQIQGPQAVAALDEALEDAERAVRLQAVQAYARAQSPESAAQALSAVLAQDPDPDVRQEAALSLGRVRSAQARAALTAAAPDSSPRVQQAVTSALANWERRRIVTKK